MDALRSLAAERWSADHRVRLAVPAVVLTFALFVAVLAGAGATAIFAAAGLLLAALPWAFVSAGRPYLLDDALARIPFAWRGERAGVWATAPVAGFLLALVLIQVLGLPGALAILACPLAAVGYTWLLVAVERRHERALMLDLTVLEPRFEGITDARPPAPADEQPADPGATQEWVPDFADEPVR
jgi:hypothetical protein